MTIPDPAKFFEAATGAHRIDKLSGSVPWKEGLLFSSEKNGRALAYSAGKMATEMSGRLYEQKNVLDKASSFYAKLETIARLAKEITDADAGVIGGVVYHDIGDAEGICATDALIRAYDEAHDAACDVIAHAEASGSAIELFLSAFPLPKGVRPLRGDILLREFVHACAFLWEIYTGKPLPKSKSGPAVRFIAAAWVDLEFPECRDLEGSIGAIAERLEK